jgi:DNA-binding response OmpR family regulator
MDHPGRILFADDEEVFLQSTADLLRQEGFEVDCARDAPEARERLAARPYDLLVSDIHMPGNVDLGLLRDTPSLNQGIPVILVTGYPSAPTAIQAIGYSVLAYLIKPIEFDELLEMVHKGVTFSRAQQVVEDSTRRVQAWADDMATLSASLRNAPGSFSGVTVNRLMGVVLGHLGGTLLDLKSLAELTTEGHGGADACVVQNCPRLQLYQQVIREGIETLERTKGAFKSRELGDLRLRLEAIVPPRS